MEPAKIAPADAHALVFAMDGMTSFEFAGHVLDLRQGRLRKGGVDVALRRKSLSLLAYLVQNPGRVLGKDELVAAVWPDVEVSDDSLTQCMKDIRKALGPDSEGLIRTIPRRGYVVDEVRLLSVEPGPVAQPVSNAPSLPDKPSIAVLPFENMSGDPEQEYFADGVVEEIITALSRFRQLFVIARNSSFTYKGRAVDVKLVGRELGVHYVLEGSVRRAGSRLRITGQLVDTSIGAHLWADRFDGGLEDIFDLQDQITARVVGAIAPKLEEAEIERAKRKPTESLDAYDQFLRGMAGFHQWTREGSDEALRRFNRAIELDPNYAAAYGMAARMYVQRNSGAWLGDRAYDVAETERLATRAAELGRDDAVALGNAGFALADFCGHLEDGDAMIDRAIGLNPNLAWAWIYRGWVKISLGEPEVALECIANARRLSPNDPQKFSFNGVSALAHLFTGRFADAYVSAEAVVRALPRFLTSHCLVAVTAALSGRMSDARVAITHLLQIDPSLRVSNVGRLFHFQRPQDAARWVEGFRKAGLPE